MKYVYENIYEAVFVSRPNRFIANVLLDEELITAHVKNTGKMKELLIPGKKCWIQKSNKPNRKTLYDLINIEAENTIVNLDSQVPNKIISAAFQENKILNWEKPDLIKQEYSIGDSRLDIMVSKNNKKLFVEIKGVNLVINNCALFPDAKTKRGVKHLQELIKLSSLGFDTMIIFLIERNDAKELKPNKIMDPEFSKTFYLARQSGVVAKAFTSIVTKNSIELGDEIKII